MKLRLIPDYSNEIDTIFLVSPLNLRNECWEEFLEFLKVIVSIIEDKNKQQKVIICCRNDVYERTQDLIFGVPYFYELNKREIKENKKILEFVKIEVLDIWIRDYFCCANIDFKDNIGGLKAVYNPNYNPFSETDDAAGQYLIQSYFDKAINIPIKLDGGNVISNSKYLFISEKLYTENICFKKQEIDDFFEKTFEQKLVTLPTEVLDVVGHTDCILRFLDDKTIFLPIYDQEYKVDNRYVMNIRRILSELDLNYNFIFLPSYLDSEINDDNIFSAKGLFLNYFRFEDHIIFPSFQDLEYYQNKIINIMHKQAPHISIHFVPCDNISFFGGAFNCISNVKYRNKIFDYNYD